MGPDMVPLHKCTLAMENTIVRRGVENTGTTAVHTGTYIVHTSMYPPPHTTYIDARCSNQVHTSYIQACILLLTPIVVAQ